MKLGKELGLWVCTELLQRCRGGGLSRVTSDICPSCAAVRMSCSGLSPASSRGGFHRDFTPDLVHSSVCLHSASRDSQAREGAIRGLWRDRGHQVTVSSAGEALRRSDPGEEGVGGRGGLRNCAFRCEGEVALLACVRVKYQRKTTKLSLINGPRRE